MRLRGALVKVLSDAMEARGTTFRDFRDTQGERGGYAARLVAYGRGGEPCLRCGTRLTMTHALVARMVGHTTRLAQEPVERWHSS